jgi:hypothetical protein
MVNRIFLAAILCAGASVSGLPTTATLADDAATAAAPSLELADQPASDEELKKESGSAGQSAAGNSSGLLLPATSDQAVGTAPSFGSGGTSTLSTNNSLTSISTLSATIKTNGFQN